MSALALVGMAVSAAGTYMQYSAQSAAQKGQAQADYYAAQGQRAAGTQNAANNFYNTDKHAIGTAIARGAASGYGDLSGSTADVIGGMAGKNVFNAETTMVNAENSAKGLQYQGDLAAFGAKQTSAAMPFALASQLVTGLTKFGSGTGAFSQGGWANPSTYSSQPASSPYRYG